MIKKDINQNDKFSSEFLNIIDYDYIYDNKPIKRIKTKPTLENIVKKLENLKNKIQNIQNCELKKSASKIVFADGNIKSPIMIIGEGPAAIIYSLEGVFAVIAAWIILNQILDIDNIIGCILILIAVIFSQLAPEIKNKL